MALLTPSATKLVTSGLSSKLAAPIRSVAALPIEWLRSHTILCIRVVLHGRA